MEVRNSSSAAMSPLFVWLSEQATAIAQTEPAPGKNALAGKSASEKRRGSLLLACLDEPEMERHAAPSIMPLSLLHY
jgi:hypothetical protein